MKPYYEAYEERYKTAHARGVSWASPKRSPIVLDTMRKYQLAPSCSILEIGCGEGRDAKAVLDSGYSLLAVDISQEAIAYCKRIHPSYRDHFRVLNCLRDSLDKKYDFIYSVAVVHMLVLDEDRFAYYHFIEQHLSKNGLALICTMGNGEEEMHSDIRDAFTLRQRHHESGMMRVACTSCRKVSFKTFQNELHAHHFRILETGLTAAPPDFDILMFAVVKSTR